MTFIKSVGRFVALFLACLTFSGLVLAQELQPTDPRYYTRRAVQAYRQKDYQTYLQNLEAALKLRPNNPAFMYNLAGAYALNGNKSEALSWLGRVSEMGMIYEAGKDDDFSSIKDSDEFKAILKRLELNRAPVGNSAFAIAVKEKGLVAEGVAFDARTGNYYLSSVHKRKILRVDKAGVVNEFAVAKDGLWAAMGIKVDTTKRFLWVATAAVPQMEDFKPEDEGRSGLLKFDLASGKLLKQYLLPNQPQEHWLGDLAIDAHGQVFATDSLTPAIYVIRPERDELELFLERGPFISPQGIAFSPDDKFMFVADYPLGIFKINKTTKTWTQMSSATPAAMTGIDGLYFYRGSLIGIQNGTNPHRVVRMRLNKQLDKFEGIDVLEANNPEFDEPTLGTIANGWLYYVANSQWGKIDNKGQFAKPELLRDLVVLKVKLDR